MVAIRKHKTESKQLRIPNCNRQETSADNNCKSYSEPANDNGLLEEGPKLEIPFKRDFLHCKGVEK